MKSQLKGMLLSTFFLFVFSISASVTSFAQTTVLSPTPTYKNVDYTLPYPGLLPDNPLYPLKAFRDKVISMFISDPLKKAKFDLLQSDKRINASLYLYNQQHDKEDVIMNTISKGENYFEDGIAQIRQAKVQGEDSRDIVRLYSKASQKHIEILRLMESKTAGDFKTGLKNDEMRVLGFEKTVGSMVSK